MTLYDSVTGVEKATLKDQDLNTRSLTFSPDGKVLAFRGSSGEVKFADLSTFKLRTDTKHPIEAGSCMTFTPDGKALAVGEYSKCSR